jgi:hypothetical protein
VGGLLNTARLIVSNLTLNSVPNLGYFRRRELPASNLHFLNDLQTSFWKADAQEFVSGPRMAISSARPSS